MTPERRDELRRWYRGKGAAEAAVNELADALDESELAYRGQDAAKRALLADRDAEIARLREALEYLRRHIKLGGSGFAVLIAALENLEPPAELLAWRDGLEITPTDLAVDQMCILLQLGTQERVLVKAIIRSLNQSPNGFTPCFDTPLAFFQSLALDRHSLLTSLQVKYLRDMMHSVHPA